jgi:hypothetical protein
MLLPALAPESSFITTRSSGPMSCCCLGRIHHTPGGVRHPPYDTARPSDPLFKAVPAYAGRASPSGEFPPLMEGCHGVQICPSIWHGATHSAGYARMRRGKGTVVTSRTPTRPGLYIAVFASLRRKGRAGSRHDASSTNTQTCPGQTCEVWLRPGIYAGVWYHGRDTPVPPPTGSPPYSPASGAGYACHVVTPKSRAFFLLCSLPGPGGGSQHIHLRSIQAGTAVGSCATSRVPGTHSSLGHTMLRTAVVSSSSPFSCCRCCWWWYRSSNSLTLRIFPPAAAGGGGFSVLSFGLWLDVASNAAPR